MMLTQELLKELVTYNKDTGEMFWKPRDGHHFTRPSSSNVFNGKWANKQVGSICSYGYLQTTIHIKPLGLKLNIKVHQLAWLYEYGTFPIGIDHLNGVRLDNRISNLREADQEINNKNMVKPSHNKSGLAGVHFDSSRNKWQVQVKKRGKRVFCKRYGTLLDACSSLISFRNSNGFSQRHGR